jgi:hypothetical protein
MHRSAPPRLTDTATGPRLERSGQRAPAARHGGGRRVRGGQVFYRRRLRIGKSRVVPEASLPPMMIGAWLFAVGLFVMGWTAPARRRQQWISW